MYTKRQRLVVQKYAVLIAVHHNLVENWRSKVSNGTHSRHSLCLDHAYNADGAILVAVHDHLVQARSRVACRPRSKASPILTALRQMPAQTGRGILIPNIAINDVDRRCGSKSHGVRTGLYGVVPIRAAVFVRYIPCGRCCEDSIIIPHGRQLEVAGCTVPSTENRVGVG